MYADYILFLRTEFEVRDFTILISSAFWLIVLEEDKVSKMFHKISWEVIN